MKDETELTVTKLSAIELEYQEQEALERTADNAWIVEWYLKKLGQIESTRAAISARYNEILHNLESEAKQLEYRYGYEFKQESEKLLAKETKKRSVKLLTGTVGYRSTADKLEIEDQGKALLWARRNLIESQGVTGLIGALDKEKAIAALVESRGAAFTLFLATKLNLGPLTEHFKTTGEVPGGCVLVDGGDKFYAKPVQSKLETGGKDNG